MGCEHVPLSCLGEGAHGGRATDVCHAVSERTPIHTHIYRYEARGVRLGGCKAVKAWLVEGLVPKWSQNGGTDLAVHFSFPLQIEPK